MAGSDPAPSSGVSGSRSGGGRGGEDVVLLVDDNAELRASERKHLGRGGYRVLEAEDGASALAVMEESEPDLVLLDVLMPGMDGYQVCRAIREREEWDDVPVVFVTIRSDEKDRRKAFAVGGSGFLAKPFEADELISTVEEHLSERDLTATSDEGAEPKGGERDFVGAFPDFLDEVMAEAGTGGETEGPGPEDLYEWGEASGIDGAAMARAVADFFDLPFLSTIPSDDLELGVLPRRFCHSRLVVPLKGREEERVLAMANPFDWDLWQSLEHSSLRGEEWDVAIAPPSVIRQIFEYDASTSTVDEIDEAADAAESMGTEDEEVGVGVGGGDGPTLDADRDPGADHPVARLAARVLKMAVDDRASDIHVEPKEDGAVIRARIDGDMADVDRIPAEAAAMLISRFKTLAGMDIAEKRKPQDGGMEAKIDDRGFKLRLATSSTPHGESLVIRLLEPRADPKTLPELGMTRDQADLLTELASRDQGLILMVGPTGSGKSTTIYSLLSLVDTRTRNLISVEDPVEYRIPFANQQQVNEKAGVTFESLLKSAVRQDPDILLLGEMRDLFSAKAAMDFASSGHLTVTTMHSSNATTAIFRLERLGVNRTDMAEALIGVVAQKLLKRLCDECKKVRPITEEERAMLAPYTDDVPDQVAEPVGCEACRDRGFLGRVGVFEIIPFEEEMARRVREGMPIDRLRSFARERGDFLIGRHGIQKVRDLALPVEDVHRRILSEEGLSREEEASGKARAGGDEPSGEEAGGMEDEGSPDEPDEPDEEEMPGEEEEKRTATILVAEDDPDSRALLERFLAGAGYDVVEAEDGADALLKLGRESVDLVLSDIRMPNLDGMKLLEVARQHESQVPVVFITATDCSETEAEGLEKGAADFIRKPIRKKVLLQRIKRVLEAGS
jgi:general secretion pathway protein E